MVVKESEPGQPVSLGPHLPQQAPGVCFAGSKVDLVHSGWDARGAEAGAVRDRYEGGWNGVLAAFEAAARGGFGGVR